jgi:hypothetical protein
MKTSLKIICAGVVFSALGLSIRSANASDLQGYECMSLNLTQKQMMDPSVRVPIKSNPTAGAAVTGNAIATIIASSPLVEEHGYVKVLELNGHIGWIQSGYLKPWTNPGGNGQRCYPAMLQTGRIGFDYR